MDAILNRSDNDIVEPYWKMLSALVFVDDVEFIQ
jgi:hypothetical protein